MKLRFKIHPPKSKIVVGGPRAPSQYSFEVAGNNNEVVVRSDPYYSLSNARRGVRDLFRIMQESGDFEIDKAPVLDIYGNALSTKELEKVIADEQEAEKGESGGFSKHDEVPGDNPHALRPNGK